MKESELEFKNRSARKVISFEVKLYIKMIDHDSNYVNHAPGR